ncbi:hypothetical protein HDU91_006174 [Kappamyces sp. JEL0680]|nr:hypothetical protein HDU91_006174 [Kappamyces sp. JEL0680]
MTVVAYFLAFKCTAKNTLIFRLAALTWIPLFAAIVSDGTIIGLSLYSTAMPIARSTVFFMILLNKIVIVLKCLVVLGLGCILTWRLKVFFGTKSWQLISHGIGIVVLLLVYVAAMVYSEILLSQIKRGVTFGQFYFGATIRGFPPPTATAASEFQENPLTENFRFIGKFYQAAFILELVLTVSGTVLFMFAVGVPSGSSRWQVIKIFFSQSSGLRLVLIILLALLKTILLGLDKELTYTGSVYFFVAALQYPLELNTVLLTSYHTARVIISGQYQSGSKEDLNDYDFDDVVKPKYSVQGPSRSAVPSIGWTTTPVAGKEGFPWSLASPAPQTATTHQDTIDRPSAAYSARNLKYSRMSEASLGHYL